MENAELFKTYYGKATAFCSRSEKCIFDVKNKLTQWQAPEEVWDLILENLIKENYVNEARYSRAFTMDKFRFNKWGRIKIRYALLQKQIPERYIEPALNEINENDYLETLRSILKSKLKSIKGKDHYSRKRSAMQFGQSRGFESDLVLSAWNAIAGGNTI